MKTVKKQTKDPKKQACGLCGSTKKKLTKTPCCDNWICDDESDYVVFSYARNSCYRNHCRYTLCSYHFVEEHSGKWQDCKKCKENFDLADYVEMGTNQQCNFEVLENPEKVSITCANCGYVGSSVNDFAMQTNKGYFCPKTKCQAAAFQHHFK